MAIGMRPLSAPLIDAFGRQITYLRLSVTDRCDLRCAYCMEERPKFMPSANLLNPAELETLAKTFIERGVKKIRLTGGEPLVRKDFTEILERVSRHIQPGRLEELTLTTNGTQLAAHATQLAQCGVRRINISIDSLDSGIYKKITRNGDLDKALEGIAAAKAAGLQCKLNVVLLRDQNADEIPDLIAWAHREGHDVTLIEVMATADTGIDRRRQFLPMSAIRESLDQHWNLTPITKNTGGPARYWKVEQTGGILGMISPLTENFCAGCNRVRVTASGQLVLCLGQEDGVNLRDALRGNGDLHAVIDNALSVKPERHGFNEAFDSGRSAVSRPMSATGG